MFKTLTQGGQVHIHQLRMFKQIVIFGFLVSFISGGGFFAYSCWRIPDSLWRSAYEMTWAKTLLALTFEEKIHIITQVYTPPSFLPLKEGDLPPKPYKRKCLHIAQDPLLQEKAQDLIIELKIAGLKSLGVAVVSLLILLMFWFRRGGSHKERKHKRGATFLSRRELAKLIKNRREASDLIIGDLPLIKDTETSHMLVTGTTGSGKTNLFHTLLPQIRHRKNKAIVVDVTGDYIARYYQEGKDFILNPLDKRSLSWNPWADCQMDSHYDVLADALIQPKDRSTHSDPFWDTASRNVFKTAMRKFAALGQKDVEKLYNFLLKSPEKEFSAFFKNTEALSHTSENNEKTTTSIRGVLSSQMEGLRQLESPKEGEGPFFSLRDWVMDEKKTGWLFITARADQRKALIPLISALMDIAINALMTRPCLTDPHGKPGERLWFIIDELIALQKLPCLGQGLAEARKFGGCFLIGFQGKSQLETLYGAKEAESMLDLFNTKVFFRCMEPATQQWISKVLGDTEDADPTENISYGANSMRDGVSLSHHTQQKALILPTELSQLEKLEAYVKLPGNYPCTKIKTPPQLAPQKLNLPFLLKPEKVRVYDDLKEEENEGSGEAPFFVNQDGQELSNPQYPKHSQKPFQKKKKKDKGRKSA